MEKIGLIQRFRISVFDVHSYKRIMKNSVGKAILFILLMTLIFEGIPFINTVRTIKQEKSNIINFVEENDLTLEVRDNQLLEPIKPVEGTFDGIRVYINKDKTQEEAISKDLSGEKRYIGLFKDKVVTDIDGVGQTIEYSMLQDFKVNSAEIIDGIDFMLNVSLVIVLGVSLIGAFIGYLVKGFVLAAVASIASMFKRKIIPFAELYKCGLYALVLPMIFCSILKVLQVPIYSQYLYYIQIIAGGIYAILAIINYEEEKKEEKVE